jgi:hypothetical protein
VIVLFLIGTDIFVYSDLGMFQTNNSINVPSSIELTNSVVDEIHINKDTSLAFAPTKDTWQPGTVALGDFIADLSYGNMNLNGLTITELRFKKRRIDSFEWIQFASVPFSTSQNIYEVIDRIVESGETYEYCVVPATSTIEGDMKTKQIDIAFIGTYISDKNNCFKLIYNFELGDINTNSPSSTIETLGGIYPIVVYNSTLNYKNGTIKCLLLSDATMQKDGDVDIKQEKLLRSQIMSFLTNKKPKILKDGNGNFLMINIVGTPKVTPNNSVNQKIYDLSFDFVETSDPYSQESLKLADLI